MILKFIIATKLSIYHFTLVLLMQINIPTFPGKYYLCLKSEDRLHLSIKNERVHFILPSVCTIFASN